MNTIVENANPLYVDITIDGESVTALKRVVLAEADGDLVHIDILKTSRINFVTDSARTVLTYGKVPLQYFRTHYNDWDVATLGSPASADEVVDAIMDILNPASTGGAALFMDDSTGGGVYGTLVGVIDGVNTDFTVSEGEYATGQLQVLLNGQTVTPGLRWSELVPGSGSFRFAIAPKPITGGSPTVITAIYSKP